MEVSTQKKSSFPRLCIFALGLFIIVGLMLPNEFRVTRNLPIHAPSAVIHQYVGDINQWSSWSPWLSYDPDIKFMPGQITQGIGASQSWSGSHGHGHLTVTATSEMRGIECDLQFDGGRSHSQSTVRYFPINPQTTDVVWTINGRIKTPILGGYIALVMNSKTGPLFVEGLYKLKKLAETEQLQASIKPERRLDRET